MPARSTSGPFARPLVSIIVPSFNQGRYLSETLQSCLAQDYRPIEVLVLDAASTDTTLDVLRTFESQELRWWSQPDNGPADGVNRGLSRASGSILTIQSSDDLFAPGAIRSAVEAMTADPDLGLVYGDVEHIDSESRVIGADVQGQFDLAAYLGRLSYVPQCGTFFSRAALEVAGGWRKEFDYAADADFWVRIALRFRVRKIDRVMGQYRYHGAQRDVNRAAIARDWTASIADALGTSGLAPRVRRYARMGIHLAQYRYASEDAWWLRTRQLYAAILKNPVGLFDERFPKRELFPGRMPIWRLLSRVKRKLGLHPRRA